MLGFKGSVTLSTIGPNQLESNPLYYKQTDETQKFEQVGGSSLTQLLYCRSLVTTIRTQRKLWHLLCLSCCCPASKLWGGGGSSATCSTYSFHLAHPKPLAVPLGVVLTPTGLAEQQASPGCSAGPDREGRGHPERHGQGHAGGGLHQRAQAAHVCLYNLYALAAVKQHVLHPDQTVMQLKQPTRPTRHTAMPCGTLLTPSCPTPPPRPTPPHPTSLVTAQEELDKQNPVIDDIDTQLNRVTNQLKSNNAKLKGVVTQVRREGSRAHLGMLAALCRQPCVCMLSVSKLDACLPLFFSCVLLYIQQRSHQPTHTCGPCSPASATDALQAQLLHRHHPGLHPAGHRRLHCLGCHEEPQPVVRQQQVAGCQQRCR